MSFYFLGPNISTRSISYIDSRNMYHMLEAMEIDPLGYDYQKLSVHLATSGGKYPKESSTKMYGARYPASIDQAKHNRDDAFYKHIEKLGISMRYGKFKVNGGIPVEKGVDVLLATDLIVDAFYNKYEHAYIFSSDTDLIPAIEAVLKTSNGRIKIFPCLGFEMRHLSNEFKKPGSQPIILSEKLLKLFQPLNVNPTIATLGDLVNKFKK